MHGALKIRWKSLKNDGPGFRLLWAVVFSLACSCLGGCAALTNPTAIGIPVRRLPPELLAAPKDDLQTIPMTLLEQPEPDVYRLAPGDILGVWIDGVLGDRNQVNQQQLNPTILSSRDQRRLPPAFGYPVAVAETGQIALPLIGPLPVHGLSLAEVQEKVVKAYREKQILQPDRERVIVTLLHPRAYHVVVVRQESSNFVTGPEGIVSTAKRGSSHVIDLFAGENDVLHALAATGGMPGLDAYNAITIQRKRAGTPDGVDVLQPFPPKAGGGSLACAANEAGGTMITIPLRWRRGDPVPIRPEDAILQSGDVVFIEARDQEVYFTGGLLPAGEHVLPRDVDLDVIEAITRVRGPLVNGAFAVSNLSGEILNPGIGNPSPSLLTVIRRTPSGIQVPIRVDLNRALVDARERILVKAGDVLILQETPGEAIARYLTRTFFNFRLLGETFDANSRGTIEFADPNR